MARRTFFSFHYIPDIWRVQIVKKCWVVKPAEQRVDGFLDSSAFEAFQRESPEDLKKFLTQELENSSVTCVLVGADTHERRWVRYEIVRSILRGNGLLAVDIHGLKNIDGLTASKGTDPLTQVGLYRTDSGIYFAEKTDDKWVRYDDYKLAVNPAVLWFPAPNSKSVVPLSRHCLRYDFVEQYGHKNIGGWIETAAAEAGR